MPPAAQTISGGLRDVLASAAGNRHGADRLHIFSLALPADLDPLSLWELNPDDWAGCWETDDERWAGLGRTLALPGDGSDETGRRRLEEAVRLGDAIGTGAEELAIRLFGGLPFQPDEGDPDWGRLSTHGFVLPRWSVFRRSGRCRLQLALSDRPAPHDNEALLEECALVEAALQLGGAVAERRASPSVSRADGKQRDGRAAWDAGIRAALREIRSGRLEKVVLSRRLDLALDGPVSGQSVLSRLREGRTGRFRFGLRQGERAFVGASPECLFEKRGSRVAVEALAGTFDLGVDPEAEALVRAAEHLFASGKDLEEHALVVRGIVDALRPLAASVEAESWPDVRAAGSLAHLSTAITAELRAGVSAFDLVGALHPTPAVGGLPRDAALRFIRRHEPVSRGLYAAPIGWLEPGGDACFAVGIRSALLWPAGARVFAGAGIVEASDPAAEWEETGAKLRWLGQLLGVSP